jgi:lipid-A-disaccharide synthase-like uncharacterized protein
MEKTLWLIFGFAGQALFAARFLVQWIKSEKEKRSIIPIHFWYFSLFGGIVMLVYAVHLRDPVFILGQFSGLFVYVRNLYLIHQEKKRRQ